MAIVSNSGPILSFGRAGLLAAGMYVDERLYEDFLKRNSET